jgi:thiamine-phosphate pyrophosphorylase
MEWRRKLRGFYAVLDRDDPALARTLLTAARVLQVRLKAAPEKDVNAVASWARRLCDERGALLVVNDDLDMALEVGADAVHLGQDDLPLAEARARIGAASRRPLIGISTHNAEQVAAAVAGGADYLGFGPVFATATKRNPDPVQGLAGLAAAVRAAGPVPVVAIGGITPERAVDVAATGAWAACAIAAVNGAPDPLAAARRVADAFAGSGSRA